MNKFEVQVKESLQDFENKLEPLYSKFVQKSTYFPHMAIFTTNKKRQILIFIKQYI